jgi:putative isomerase
MSFTSSGSNHPTEHNIRVDFTGSERIEGALRFIRYESIWKDPLPDFEECLAEREREYNDWAMRIPQVSSSHQETAQMAWFLLWNCQVPAGGALTRNAVYMSKFWMTNIWAWDNCFNALAVARANPELAWQQLLLFFDHQDPQGMVPDMINDLEPVYAFTKPPIHGWTIRKLVEILGSKRSYPYLEAIYRPMCKLTDWWFTYRDFDGDGMPQYHHGNDSGWDNATIFDQGYPTEGADLAAYLVLQCETLSYISNILGKTKAADRWQDKANLQLKTLLEKGVKNNRFFSPLDGKRRRTAVPLVDKLHSDRIGETFACPDYQSPLERPFTRRSLSDRMGLRF